ncbi:unnamed protein product [Ectocarpus sp. 13 AM-2016]
MAMSHVPAHIRQAHGGHPTRGRRSSRAGQKAQVSGTRQNWCYQAVTTTLPSDDNGSAPGIRAQGTTDARAQGTTDAPGSEEGSEDGDDADEGEQRAPVVTEEPGLLAGVGLDSFLHATEKWAWQDIVLLRGRW